MKCSYHPEVDSQEACNVCSRPLCSQCAHKIRGIFYCQDCLVRGAEWAGIMKERRIPPDAPKRAAFCSLIPGMGPVYNNEYMKAVTYFAVFAALIMMGDRIHGVFGFGAFIFLIFTMFDSYRTAEARIRARLESETTEPETPAEDRVTVGWGVFLIALGVVFLLQNIIPYRFLDRLWPLAFIFLGVYLVYQSLQGKKNSTTHEPSDAPVEIKEG